MPSYHRMPLSPRRRLAVVLVLLLLAGAALAAVLVPGGNGAPPAAPGGQAAATAAPAAPSSAGDRAGTAVPAVPQRPLRVAGRLPAWRAPGGRLEVEGTTTPRARVRLLVAGRAVASGRAGARGRFVLAGRTPLQAGRYPVVVAEGGGAGRRVVLGALRVRAVTLAAVGDVTFGDGVGWRIARTSPRYPWLDVAPVLRAADIATANLEGAVSDRGTPEPDKLFTFRGPPAAARAAVRFAGIDVFTLANNHSKDYGALALLDTAKAVRDAGGKAVGAGADLAAARAAAVVERGGLRVAFLGYNDVPPWEFTARKGVPGTAPAVPEDIARDVRVARSRADVVVVWFHWGYELQPAPNGRQVELARAAFAAGATVVLGAHAHVLLDVEEPSPRRLVAWSLGNFVFVARSPRTADTGILHVALSARGVVGHRLQRARIVAEQPRLAQPASRAPVGR